MSNNTPNIEQLTSLINSLQSQINQINSGNIAGTNILSMSQKLDNINDLTIPSLRDNINSAQNTQDNLSKSHTNFQNRLDNHKNNLGDLQNQIQGASANHNTLANNINNLNNQHNDLNNKVLNTSNNNQNLQNNVNNINSSHQNISSEIQNLKYQMQNFNTKLETITPTDSQHSQLMSKIDNLSNTLTPIMVKTHIAQQTSNNLYAQLQPLHQTVNNQTAQIHANSSGILQNAAQSASNFGAFYGMGDDGDGSRILLERGGGGGSSTTPNPAAGSSTTPNPSGGDGSSTTPAPSVKSVTPAEQIEITAKFRKDFVNDQSTSMPDGVNDLSYLGFYFPPDDIKGVPDAALKAIPPCPIVKGGKGIYDNVHLWYTYRIPEFVSNCLFVWKQAPRWINTCKAKESLVYTAFAPLGGLPYSGAPALFTNAAANENGASNGSLPSIGMELPRTVAADFVHNTDDDVYCYRSKGSVSMTLNDSGESVLESKTFKCKGTVYFGACCDDGGRRYTFSEMFNFKANTIVGNGEDARGAGKYKWSTTSASTLKGLVEAWPNIPCVRSGGGGGALVDNTPSTPKQCFCLPDNDGGSTPLLSSWKLFDGNLDGKDVNNWNVNYVTDMTAMLYNNTNFNGDISKWNTINVTNMAGMFYGASSFDGDISSWDVSNVIDMASMFNGASNFTNNLKDMKGWNVINVTNMNNMFKGASVFNQDITTWDVSNVTNMETMFYNAVVFNQSIGNWNVINVGNIKGWLKQSPNSSSFYQDLSTLGQSPGISLVDSSGNLKKEQGAFWDNILEQQKGPAATITNVGKQGGINAMNNILAGQSRYSNSSQGRLDLITSISYLPPGLTAGAASSFTGQLASAEDINSYYLATAPHLRGFKGNATA